MSVALSAGTRGPALSWRHCFLVGPAALAAMLVVGLLILIIWMSVGTGVPGHLAPYTLRNYYDLLADPYYYRVMLTTLGFAGVTIIISVSWGVMFAWLVERTDMPYKIAAVSLISVGILFPSFLQAMGWVFLLHPRIGALNTLFAESFGLREGLFNIATVWGMGFVQGLSLAPLAYVMVSGSLRAMNPALVEAANIHGVSKLKTTFHIELKLVWPALFAAVIWIFTIAIAAFDVPAVIGMANNIFTFSTALYVMVNPTEGLPRYGLAGAYGTLMLGVALVLMLPYFAALRQSHRYQIISGKSYQLRAVELGRWSYAGWALVAVYFCLAFVMPLVAIVWVSLLPYVQPASWEALGSLSFSRYIWLVSDTSLRSAWLNTLFLMVVVPTLLVSLSATVSWVVTRSRMRGRLILDAIAFLPHPVPNILFALAIAFVALLIADVVPIYGSIFMLVVAYVVTSLGFGTRVLNNSMMQVHRELEEAAEVGGVSVLQVFGRVILPLVRPAVAYAWAWNSLNCYRELTVAVLLAAPGTQVLSTFIWGELHGGGIGDAAAAAVLMMVVMSPIIVGLWAYARRQQQIALSRSE